MLADNIKTLSRSEKILLMNELCEDLSENIEASPLCEDQIQLLDSQYEAFLEAPEEGVPWSQLKTNLKELL
jgi:uncharacterized protein YllA (UPF0747 family)